MALFCFLELVYGCSAFGQSSKLQVPREWSDRSGEFSIEATIFSANAKEVTLLKNQPGKKAKRVALPLERLSDADQKYASGFARARLKELKLAESRSAVASECFAQFKEFVDQGFVDDSNRLFVEARLEALEAHSKANRVLIKETYLSPEQFVELRNESESKTREWLKLDGKNFGKLRGIIANNPSCLTAPLLLGVYYDVSKGDAAAAENILQDAVEQGKRYRAVASEADRQNLHAAINNLAVATVRQGHVGKAVRLWNEIIVESPVSGIKGAVNTNINRVAAMIERNFSGLTAKGKAKSDLAKLRSNPQLEKLKGSGGWGVVLPVDQQLGEIGFGRFLKGSSKFHSVSSGVILDTRCVQCQGTDKLRCSREGCVKGKIERRIMDNVYAPSGHFLGRKVVRKEYDQCRTCRGDGNVSCPCCEGGSQP